MIKALWGLIGAAAFALSGAVSDAQAQGPKKGGTLQFAISAETPHYDPHGSDTYATLDFAARIGQQQAFDDSEFFASVLVWVRKVLRMPSQNLKKFFITALAYRSTQLAHLLHSLW